jgi:hypothetical protein
VKTAFLVISLVLSAGSALPYIRDILRRRTKPSIVTWFTWTLLTAIATAAEFAAGEYTTAIFTSISTLSSLFIVLLGLRYGHAKYGLLDLICQISVLIGIALWIMLNSPLLAVVVMIIIDLVGTLPTLRHAWKRPGEETLLTFVMGFASATFVIIALKTYTAVGVVYPAYLGIVNIIIAGTILARRRSKLRARGRRA